MGSGCYGKAASEVVSYRSHASGDQAGTSGRQKSGGQVTQKSAVSSSMNSLVWPAPARSSRVEAQCVIAVPHHPRAMQAAVGILQLEVEIVLRDGQLRGLFAQQVERTRIFVRLVVGRVQEDDPGRTALEGDQHLARQDGGPAFQPKRRQVLADGVQRPPVALQK